MNLYYLGKGGNFGDLVNEAIFQELFHQEIQRTRFYTADYFGIGSILSKVLYDQRIGTSKFSSNIKRKFYSVTLKDKPITILGSGFIEDVRKTFRALETFRELKVVALRGRKTKEILEEIIGSGLHSVALGDPGLLASELIKGEEVHKKYNLGVIPHIVDQDSDFVRRLSKRNDIRILNIRSEPRAFLKEVAACKAIASSTLHGLIASDSLNIPNLWVKMSDKIYGEDFKYHDYYSTFGVELKPVDVRIANLNGITQNYVSDAYSINQEKVKLVKRNLEAAIRESLRE